MKLRTLQVNVCFSALLLIPFLMSNAGQAEQIPVRHQEGELHGFLELQTLEGKNIAYGETIQTVRGSQVTSRLLFRFLDGSIYDDTTVFSQDRMFRLIRDHLIEKGPSFKETMDSTVDGMTGEVSVRYTDKDGKEKSKTEQLDLPNDVANGMLFTLLKDIREDAPETTVSMVATTPKPRIVRIHITPHGREPFSVGSVRKQAIHYVLKVEIGGVAGAVAPLVGKQPPDTHGWVVVGGAPAIVRNEGPFYADGPIWRTQQANPPVFNNQDASARPKTKRATPNGGALP
jgi:hypothetical protein